jgi:copper resistance protein C
LTYGFTVQYSLQYLQSYVQDIGLPAPFNRMIPLVEFAFQTPLEGDDRGKTTWTVNPGIILPAPLPLEEGGSAMTRGIRRAARSWRVGGALLLLAPALAGAHAVLVRSKPVAKSVVRTAPDRVELWFSERLEPAFARLTVWSAAGTQVDLGDAAVAPADPRQLSVGLRPLGPGRYVVKYRVLSVDGHVVESQFPFTLHAP